MGKIRRRRYSRAMAKEIKDAELRIKNGRNEREGNEER
jgi:hypothetical protein